MSQRLPPGHPLAPHPGLPPHPLDGIAGAFKHTTPLTARDHEAHAQRLLRAQRARPMDPRLLPLNSAQGHDLPPSPPDAIGGASLDGFSELPLMQPGAGVASDSAPVRPVFAQQSLITPYPSRGSTVQLTETNTTQGFPFSGQFLLPVYSQVSGVKQQIAELNCESEDCVAATVFWEVASPPKFTVSGGLAGYVVFEIQYGYGGVTFIRNVWQQRGRIVVVGNKIRVSAYMVITTSHPASVHAINATARAMIIPTIDGQLRSTTAWAPFNSEGAGFSNLFPMPCTLWRVGGVVATTTGGTPIFLVLIDASFPDNVTAPAAGGAIGSYGINNSPFIIGEVPQGGTFSADIATSGFDFASGLVIAASTSDTLFALDAGAQFSGQCELLVN